MIQQEVRKSAPRVYHSLIYITEEGPYPSSPSITRKIRNHDILLINRRPIQSNAAVFPILCIGVLPLFQQSGEWLVQKRSQRLSSKRSSKSKIPTARNLMDIVSNYKSELQTLYKQGERCCGGYIPHVTNSMYISSSPLQKLGPDKRHTSRCEAVLRRLILDRTYLVVPHVEGDFIMCGLGILSLDKAPETSCLRTENIIGHHS